MACLLNSLVLYANGGVVLPSHVCVGFEKARMFPVACVVFSHPRCLSSLFSKRSEAQVLHHAPHASSSDRDRCPISGHLRPCCKPRWVGTLVLAFSVANLLWYRRSHCLLYVTVSGVHTAVLATIHLLGEKSLSLNGFQPTGTEASVWILRTNDYSESANKRG